MDDVKKAMSDKRLPVPKLPRDNENEAIISRKDKLRNEIVKAKDHTKVNITSFCQV